MREDVSDRMKVEAQDFSVDMDKELCEDTKIFRVWIFDIRMRMCKQYSNDYGIRINMRIIKVKAVKMVKFVKLF